MGKDILASHDARCDLSVEIAILGGWSTFWGVDSYWKLMYKVSSIGLLYQEDRNETQISFPTTSTSGFRMDDAGSCLFLVGLQSAILSNAVRSRNRGFCRRINTDMEYSR
jgi:hypothetical protein